MVEQRDAARSVGSVPAAEAEHEIPAGAAVQGVRTRVARILRQIVRGDCPDQRRLPGIRVGVVDVDLGRPYARQQQVAPPQSLGMVPGVRECAAARVPAEMVEFVSPGRQVGPADDLPVPGRLRVSAEHGQRVRLLRRAVERHDVGQLLGRRVYRVRRAAVKGGVDVLTSGIPHRLVLLVEVSSMSDKPPTFAQANARIMRRPPRRPTARHTSGDACFPG
jgi:hypothetical protein